MISARMSTTRRARPARPRHALGATLSTVVGLGILAACGGEPVQPRAAARTAPGEAAAPLYGTDHDPSGRIPGRYLVVYERALPDPAAVTAEISARLGVRPIVQWDAGLLGFAADLPPAALDAVRRHPHVA